MDSQTPKNSSQIESLKTQLKGLNERLTTATHGAERTTELLKFMNRESIALPEGTNADGTRREAGFYNPNSSTPNARLSADDLRKIDPKLKSGQEFNLKKVGLQYEDGKGYYTMDINGNGKDRNYLNDAQVSALPSHVTENPTKLSGNGNSIAIETKIGGIKYDVIYKHLNEIPVTPSDGQFKAGMQIGTLGTTGSSNGAHLHLEITSKTEPNIPQDFYEKRESKGDYVINPEYFLRVMANGGANASSI